MYSKNDGALTIYNHSDINHLLITRASSQFFITFFIGIVMFHTLYQTVKMNEDQAVKNGKL